VIAVLVCDSKIKYFQGGEFESGELNPEKLIMNETNLMDMTKTAKNLRDFLNCFLLYFIHSTVNNDIMAW